MKHKKGQAAFEYLTTYGWVIMFVLIGIGAILYFDLGGMVSILPERCWFGSQLVCEDYSVRNWGGNTQVRFDLRNNFENDVYLDQIKYTGSVGNLVGCNKPHIGVRQVQNITCTLQPQRTRGEKITIPIQVRFRDNASNSKPKHILQGEILTKVN